MNNQEIAREAAEVISRYVTVEYKTRIILAAIEKAMSGQRIYGEWGTAVIIPDEAAQPQRSEHTDECIGRLCSHVKPAHASEPWTPKILKRITRNTELSPLVEEFIIHAHNAALQPAHASEQVEDSPRREWTVQEAPDENRSGEFFGHCRVYHGQKLMLQFVSLHIAQDLVNEINSALAADSKTIEDLSDLLHSSSILFDELAAERERSKDRRELADYYATECGKLRDQLAAAREKLKPLVEALEQALSDIETSNSGISTCSKIRTALAKVKE